MTVDSHHQALVRLESMRRDNAAHRVTILEARAARLHTEHNQALTDLAHARARHAYWEERATE